MVASKLRENARLRQVRWVRVNASKNARTLSRRLTFAALIYPRRLGPKKKKSLKTIGISPRPYFYTKNLNSSIDRSFDRSYAGHSNSSIAIDRSIELAAQDVNSTLKPRVSEIHFVASCGRPKTVNLLRAKIPPLES